MTTIGSLFAGIGGLELGLEWAGLGPVRWQVEIDAWCRMVLAQHWPDAQRFADVRTVGARELDHVDIVCGGFPCTGFSRAGRRAGFADPRSGLWGEFARIVVELGPAVVVVENSDELARDGVDVVLADLAGAGYEATAQVRSAASAGAPHGRPRTFVVAYRRDDGREGLAAQDGPRGPLDEQRRRVADGCRVGVGYMGGAAQSRLVRGAHGVPGRVDAPAWPAFRGEPQHAWEPPRIERRRSVDRGRRIRALGNAVVPAVARQIGVEIVERLRSIGAVGDTTRKSDITDTKS